MREYNFNIEESLTNGIRPDERTIKNSDVLFDAYNVEVSEYGMRPFKRFIDPFEGQLSVNFPFPQLFHGKADTIALNEQELFVVDTSVVPWQLEPQGLTVGSIGVWHMADCQDYWLLTNGTDVVFKDVGAELNFEDVRVRKFLDVNIGSLTYHRGRVVVGGFEWQGDWLDILEEFQRELDDPILTDYDDVDRNYVLWSSIGGGDFPHWLFASQNAVFGPLENYKDFGYDLDDISRTMLIEKIRRNEFGWMPMPFQGDILGVAPFGKNVLVLGAGGVAMMYLAGGTYGLQPLSPVGVASRGSFYYDEGGVMWLDREGSLWITQTEGGTERLGYEHLFKPMLGTDVTITKNPEDGKWFISNGEQTFCYSQGGMTRISEHPTSLFFVDGGMVGLFDSDESDEALLVSNVYDIKMRGLKTITTVMVGSDGEDISVALDYRYNSNEDFERSDFISVNKEGNAYLNVTALEFRVVLRCNDIENFKPDFIDVRYQVPDKRNIRGYYANSSSS